jgi:hypothetical protein
MSNLETVLQQQNFDLGATVPVPADVASPEVSQLGAVPSASSTFSSVSCPQLAATEPETASKQGSRRARTIFIPLHEWEGTVTRLLDDAFIGSMVDLTEREKGFQDEAEFPLSDLPPDAHPLLKEGAIFRWLIGYSIVDGTQYRASKIVFRRMPAWTKRDLVTAAQYASDLSKSVTWE